VPPFLFWVVANLRFLPGGVFHRLVGLELVVLEFAIDPLDLAHIDLLDDVAGFRIDRQPSTLAGILHALGGSQTDSSQVRSH